MRERVEAMKAIWTQDEASYHGEFVDFDRDLVVAEARAVATPARARRRQRAGRSSTGCSPTATRGCPTTAIPDLIERIAELRERAADAGREIPVIAFGVPADPAVLERARERRRARAPCTGFRRRAAGRSSARSTASRTRSGAAGRMNPEEARRRFAAARVARLATADAAGVPHLVPVVFAVDGDLILTAVDRKPKRTTALKRLANVRANPRVALLADHYDDEDWDALWWVRADGTGRVLEPADPVAAPRRRAARRALPQHRAEPPEGPVLAVEVLRWSGWVAR